MSDLRVTVQWTESAKQGLAKLPKKVRIGLFDKVEELFQYDPTTRYKPLSGPLDGCYTMKYSRYRLIYKAEKREMPGGDVVVHVRVVIIAVGIRKAKDKKDVYELAQKLVQFGLISDESQNDDGDDDE